MVHRLLDQSHSDHCLVDDPVAAENIDPCKASDNGVRHHREDRRREKKTSPFLIAAADEIRRRNTAHHTDKGGDDRDLHGSQKDLSVILVLKKVHVCAERVISRKHAWNQNAKQRDHQEQK